MLSPFPHSTPLRVLLVEDNAVNRKLLEGLLLRDTCDVTLAANGEEAVEQVQQGDFDVVLMDIQMPVMDGLTATRLIRQREAAIEKHTPIIGVTAGIDREACLEAGMDAYLPKPVRADMLRAMLAEVLDC